jgi:NtrC-family two-component system sensor histidine kinase KinB
MPPASELNFIANTILFPNTFGIPAIVTDSSSRVPYVNWRNVPVDSTLAGLSAEDSLRTLARLAELRAEMDATYAPIPIEISFPGAPGLELRQYVHYGESTLVKELRLFPYVQLFFVGLFILVGYLGFSYVRRSEQSSLWVGMAKEAAHQLGTPISSLMGWVELLKLPDLPGDQQEMAVEEIEKDISRLRRVTSRFSDIGSLPKLDVMPLAPIVDNTADYIRRRMPQQGKHVSLLVAVPPDLRAPLNAELFEWVIENLLKNALDAIETNEGKIEVTAARAGEQLRIEVRDTGKGIDRRQWKNVFRPGYSTKKRGWGLGLSLAKRIVEDYHGGTLTLAGSRLGHGSTFRIELPAA